jgi:hypothetical protein
MLSIHINRILKLNFSMRKNLHLYKFLLSFKLLKLSYEWSRHNNIKAPLFFREGVNYEINFVFYLRMQANFLLPILSLMPTT